MKIVKMETHMLSQKVIANVTPEFARVYNIPEGHTSVGFFSADNDDIGYLAVDDASKKANIKLIHAETYYGGTTCSWSKYGGSVFVLFSGPKVEDVKSGLRYVRDFIENHSELCNFDGDEEPHFMHRRFQDRESIFRNGVSLSLANLMPILLVARLRQTMH